MNSKNLKIILFVLLLMFFIVTLYGLKYKTELDAERFYNQGQHFYNSKDYSNAYYNFKKISRFSNIYEISLLKQYMCANKLQDIKTARLRLNELSRKSKNPYIKSFAMYYETSLSYEAKIISKKQAYAKFNKLINFKQDNDFYYASKYKLALLDNDKLSSKNNLIEYLKYAPIGKFAFPALNEVKKYNDILNKEDKEIIADSYYQNSKYEEALNYYLKSNISSCWYKISKCYRRLNRRQEELNAINNGLKLKHSEVEAKDIDDAINRLIALSGQTRLQVLQDLYSKSPYSYIYPTVIYNLAESNQSIHSMKLYEQIIKNYPDSYWASNSLWEIFWYNYSLNRFNTCIKLGKIHQNKYSKSIDAPRVAYWSAKAMLNEKKNQEAREQFYKIIKDYPLSYYAFLSARQLKISKARQIITKKQIKSFDINSLNSYLFKDNKTLLFLANNNDIELLDELKINDEYIKSWLMHKKQNYPNSINTAKNEYLKRLEEDSQKIASYSDKELKLIYPILYNEEINEYAREFKQSPYLFLSLIREESHFNKDAKSSAGAVGLVQLMPATASFIEKREISSDELKQNNIKIGLSYFNYLVDLFDDEYLAILSYNAGPGNIKKWQNDPFIGSNEIDKFVENIPYLETKNYIKKVLSAYWIYFNIYK